MAATSLVDWALGRAIARALAGEDPSPAASTSAAGPPVAEALARPRLHRPRPGEPRSQPSGVDRRDRVDRGRTWPRCVSSRPRSRRARPPRSRCRGRSTASCAAGCGAARRDRGRGGGRLRLAPRARPVRGPAGGGGAASAAAVRRREPRADAACELGADPEPLPALGRDPRADAFGPVRRGAVAARPPRRARRAADRGRARAGRRRGRSRRAPARVVSARPRQALREALRGELARALAGPEQRADRSTRCRRRWR